MILYFSGTGNSRYVARRLAAAVGDQLVSLNEYIKKEQTGDFVSEKPWVFVTPTYAWQMPRVVRDFIRRSTFEGSRAAYFVLTCGESVGNAAGYAGLLCREKKLEFQGLGAVVMPENYVAMFPVPTREEAAAIVDHAGGIINQLASCIHSGSPFREEDAGLSGRMKSGVANLLFYPTCVSARGFRVTDACIGCGECKAFCPLNNIELEDGKPQWGKHCTHCMACISACPQGAIEYKMASVGRPRHYLE